MSELKFVECRNCSTIHYVIDKTVAENLKNKTVDGFSSRDLTRCSNCGSEKDFSIVSELYMGHFSPSDKIPPVFLDYEKVKKATKNKPW